MTTSMSDTSINASAIPRYLIQNEFSTGLVSPNSTIYYYLPVSPSMGEISIFLNKSWVSGYKNGDLALSMSINNHSELGIAKWVLPTINKSLGYSSNKFPTQPEFISICAYTFSQVCLNNVSCNVIIGVHNLDTKLVSRFRLIAITDRI